MDEASRLVSELQQKLSDLDLKVWKYQQDMAAEFEKYAESLLRDVPKDVSETVSKTMAEAVKGCSSLYPKTPASLIDSCGTGTDLENGVGSDTIQPHVSPTPAPVGRKQEDMEDSPRSPHARDLEFRGVFTPSYLPLLDSTSRNERKASYDRPNSPRCSVQRRDIEPLQIDASTDTKLLLNPSGTTRPPTPRRKNTDEASIASDHSEGTIRRSALRRSSSASNKDRQSPRRVRFDVAGEEVLPTASPQSMSVLDREVPTSIFGDNEEEAGSEQIEDVERPPPKRISSSQALRALSRSPLVDDGTQWTTVSAPPDGSASIATSGSVSQESSCEDLYMGNRVSRSSLGDALHTKGGNVLAKMSENTFIKDKVSDSGNEVLSDDEDMLDMPPLRRQSVSAASTLFPVGPANVDKNKLPPESTRPNNVWRGTENFGLDGGDLARNDAAFDKGGADEDGLFCFDENMNKRVSAPESDNSPEELEDEERDQFDTESSTYNNEARDVPCPSGHARSPARQIVRPTKNHAESYSSTGVVGSYKGRTFSLPIVSPEAHARGAAVGPLDSFVGSLDGRSGMDASNLQSYRASGGVGGGNFAGTPRSMSERLQQEDIMKANANRGR
ncbi:hypothetical protein BUE80_DR013042 [Diplocarpon rosae]|nr:hypothetical protein BUE80_DR013042 [Diplocarpon rosae]